MGQKFSRHALSAPPAAASASQARPGGDRFAAHEVSVFLEHNLVLALVLATALAGAVGAGWKLASLWTGWTSGMQAVIVSAPSR